MSMVAAQLKKISPGTAANESSKNKYEPRASKELVIAFCGALGSGIADVVRIFSEELKAADYEVVSIKVSNLIKGAIAAGLSKANIDESTREKYYESLQSAGNNLRKDCGTEVLSQLVVQEIAKNRTKQIPEGIGIEAHVPKRLVYLVDQLKHPDEVVLLRTIYGNLFYLVGVLSLHDVRRMRLVDEGISPANAETAMERDRKEPVSHGQQLEKTLHRADFFTRHNKANQEQLRESLKRFIALLHGVNGITPTKVEYGMFVAFSAAMKSACLSRQVGAAIQDDSGRIIATGTNDVPRFGGGLYGPDHAVDDRCVHGGICHNDKHKKKLIAQIRALLGKQPNAADATKTALTADAIESVSNEIYESTRIGDLIEFSRAVHAEMDALISLARGGIGSTVGATLYTTTFPCHSCARHIVAAGISAIYYIEPYEKSLAKELHGDAITLDCSDLKKDADKVQFIQFEGIAPRLYRRAFNVTSERKDSSGKALRVPANQLAQVTPEYLDNYRQMESKVVQHLADLKQT